jgi:hypothetical protein
VTAEISSKASARPERLAVATRLHSSAQVAEQSAFRELVAPRASGR